MYRILFSAGLAIAAIGIFVQYLTGVPGFPKIPPGPIILGAAALLVAFVPTKWALWVGVAGAAFVLIGMIAALSTKGLSENIVFPGPLLGILLQMTGLILALVFGFMTIRK